MVVIYGNEADRPIAEALAKKFGTQLVYVDFRNYRDILDRIIKTGGEYILVGGDSVNLITRFLADNKIIPRPSYFPNKCYLARAKYENATFYVIAGWEKEHTEFAGRLILNIGFPDFDSYEKDIGKNYIVFDVNYIPNIVKVELLPLIGDAIANFIRANVGLIEQKSGCKIYEVRLIDLEPTRLFNINIPKKLLTICVGEPVVRQAAIPAAIILAIIAVVGAVSIIIAWAYSNIWTKQTQVRLTKELLQEEVAYTEEKIRLLESINRLSPELRDEALKIIQTTPSYLQGLVEKVELKPWAQQLTDIIKWVVIAGGTLMGIYFAGTILTKAIERRPVIIAQPVQVQQTT